MPSKDELIEQCIKRRGEIYCRTLEYFNNMRPFKKLSDIPDVPVVDEDDYKDVIIPNLIRCGAIPLDRLTVNSRYIGKCRNAKEAVWNGKEFSYTRRKLSGEYIEKIDHFQQDDGFGEYDVFVPLKEKVFKNQILPEDDED